MAVEQTLVIVKPDGVQRGLVGEILGRLERRGLKLAALRMLTIEPKISARHYAEHEGKPFYAGLIDYIGSGPSVVAVFAGPRAIQATRATVGATDPVTAAPGTIRGDFGMEVGRNLVHASDSAESAAREIALFFGSDATIAYAREIDRWILE
ncbi:MAG TPA: nucleoside-diphosphate kinase [Thermomicrobiales bacterium]|nr:nucleoside-diphosphate kinase [Thermomicrobiales bacterium]